MPVLQYAGLPRRRAIALHKGAENTAKAVSTRHHVRQEKDVFTTSKFFHGCPDYRDSPAGKKSPLPSLSQSVHQLEINNTVAISP